MRKIIKKDVIVVREYGVAIDIELNITNLTIC